MDTVATTLKNIISESLKCDLDTIDENVGLGKHPNWDSLHHVIIIVNIEKVFSIEIKDESVEKLLTFRDLKYFIENVTKQK